MVGKLVTFPLRVWFRSAQLLTRATAEVAVRTVSFAGRTVGLSSPGRSANGQRPDWQEPSPRGRDPRVSEEREPSTPSGDPKVSERQKPSRASSKPRVSERESRESRPERTRPTPAPSISAVRPLRPEPPETDSPPETAHVSEEPVLVQESAEPGAEEGAGAAVTVIEPWNGYQHMNAREVIDRAKQASPAELAAVRLYEARHRSRQTVLAAVDRQLKLGNSAA